MAWSTVRRKVEVDGIALMDSYGSRSGTFLRTLGFKTSWTSGLRISDLLQDLQHGGIKKLEGYQVSVIYCYFFIIIHYNCISPLII